MLFDRYTDIKFNSKGTVVHFRCRLGDCKWAGRQPAANRCEKENAFDY